MHVAVSGVAHNLCADDEAAIDLARRYLSYFPLNAWERPARKTEGDVGERRLDAILDMVAPTLAGPIACAGCWS